MNDQDRNLVEQVVKAAGKAGEQGFEYLVNFTLVTGIVDLVGYTAWMALGLYLGKRLFTWKPEEPEGHCARGAGMVVCALFFAMSIAGQAESIVKILAPAGAAIHAVVK